MPYLGKGLLTNWLDNDSIIFISDEGKRTFTRPSESWRPGEIQWLEKGKMALELEDWTPYSLGAD